MTREIRYTKALNEALREEMKRDSNVIVLGEDVRASLYGVTRDLFEEFGPERVIDTPISEAGFTGMALGAAMSGLKPVVEYQITTLPYVAMDQLVNQIMKIRYMTGGQTKVPVTIRLVSSGAGGGRAGQHSDQPHPMLMHAGFRVVMPSTPYDAKGLLKTAIRGDDPVMVFESAKVMGMRGPVPDEDFTVPLANAAVRREGSDVTIVAVGYLVHEAIRAADDLSSSHGIECEVIDPRSLHPLDEETILRSVAKTGRAVVADDANRTCGFAAEVAALIADRAFESLIAPVKRITRSGYIVPYSSVLEASVMPSAAAIKETVLNLVKLKEGLRPKAREGIMSPER